MGRGMDLVSIDDAAQQMGLHPAHVRRLVREGEIPGRKVGARWLVSEEALRQRDRLQAAPGRPLSAPMAWAVLNVVDAGLRESLDLEPGDVPR
jgi:excisionase family DNA binding protein